ncbi:hypothetical protein H1R20_g10727, partial [Candolleomyces eurysporus]
MISFRLLLAARRNSQLLPSFSSKVYISVVAILVEAALPLSITGIILACFMNQSRGAGATRPHQGIFRILYFFFLSISPQMIIFRVTSGRALAKDLRARNRRDEYPHEDGGSAVQAMSTALDFARSGGESGDTTTFENDRAVKDRSEKESEKERKTTSAV